MGKTKSTHITQDYQQLSPFHSHYSFEQENAVIEFPSKDQWRQRLCSTMMQWASRPDALTIMGFCRYMKIPYDTLTEWVAKYDDIRAAYKEMKRIIADNRQVGSITKKLDGNFAYRDMHRLEPEWKEVDTYHSNLKKSEAPEPTTFNIVGKLPHPDVISKEEIKKDQEKIL